MDDKNIANPALGELAFKIDESIATKVLQINDRRFFITNGISITVATTTATTKGEEDIVTGSTGATAASPVLSSSNAGIGVIEAPSSVIKSLEPLSSTSGIGPIGAAGGQSTPSLVGSALIAALSAEMAGYKATKWADQTIINYFLIPGKPGYLKYPRLTKDEFIKAAKGILAPASLLKIRFRSRGFGRNRR